MSKHAQPKPGEPVSKNDGVISPLEESKFATLLSQADVVVERVATRALSGNAFRRTSLKGRAATRCYVRRTLVADVRETRHAGRTKKSPPGKRATQPKLSSGLRTPP